MGPRWRLVVIAILLLAGADRPAAHAAPLAEGCFAETGKCVGARFLAYWRGHGGLAQQGLPITDEFDEVGRLDGKVRRVQYFERARFEYHPENLPPYDVLLGQLGRERYAAQDRGAGSPGGAGASGAGACFAATGRCARGAFYRYWLANGGLTQQGYPISDEFDETSPSDGKVYRTQYFERARFEWHPENAAPYDVLLGLLGREQHGATYRDDRLVENCADPSLIRGLDAYWYMYCTSDALGDRDRDAAGRLIFHPMAIFRSVDLLHWLYVGDVFGARPARVGEDAGLWAPDVQFFNGRYYLYYTASDTRLPGGGSAIGVATSASPAGPWADSGVPAVEPHAPPCCREMRRWVFDPAVVSDGFGQRWLIYGSYAGGLAARQLSADGLHTDIVSQTQIAVPNRFEGAAIVRHGDYFYLFASSTNCCNGPLTGYGVFVGRSRALLGPYVDRDGIPFLAGRAGGTPALSMNGNRWVGPGHNTVFTDFAGQDWFLYHAIDRTAPYFAGAPGYTKRPARLDPLDWIEGWPTVRAGRGALDRIEDAPVAQPGHIATYRPVGPTPDGDDEPIAALSDEFDGAAPGPQWSWVRRPAAGGYGMLSGTFRFETQQATLEGDANDAAVLAEPAPRGDYIVETRFKLTLPLEGCCYNYVQAGFVIYGDDDNWLELAHASIWETRQIVFAKEQAPVPPGFPRYGNSAGGPPGEWTSLRIVKRTIGGEERYTAYTSRGGAPWTRIGTWTHALGGNARIGLVAMGGAGFTAYFDYVRVYTRTPL